MNHNVPGPAPVAAAATPRSARLVVARPSGGGRATRRGRLRRRGVAAAELAVCLPLLVTLVFGSLQACNMIHLKQGLTTAAYEGVLEFAKPDATISSVEARIQNILQARNISAASIQVASGWSSLSQIPTGVPVTIAVSAPVPPNLVTPVIFPPESDIASQAVVVR